MSAARVDGTTGHSPILTSLAASSTETFHP